jgi:hypothetical protein
MAFPTLRTFRLSKATSSTQCGGLTARTYPEIYFNVDATNCQTIVAEEFSFVTPYLRNALMYSPGVGECP